MATRTPFVMTGECPALDVNMNILTGLPICEVPAFTVNPIRRRPRPEIAVPFILPPTSASVLPPPGSQYMTLQLNAALEPVWDWLRLH